MHVIGTAGHVDHGKSTLVRALTGIDPDRFEEEKRRGLTIDLGFAWRTLPSGREIGIVDVPGHERFIRNMLAGAGGIDVALFVVAADEGWMPQSAEHLQVLDFLAIRGGVVALTKCDLVGTDLLDLVRDDVWEHLRGTCLDDAAIVGVSATTGEGLDDLLRAVDDVLGDTPSSEDRGRPRLFVDRSFTIAGAGTVVTGTLTGGRFRVGETVQVVPDGQTARVRSLQTHQRSVDEAVPGSRVAMNLVGLERVDVIRGDAVVRPDEWLLVDTFAARLRAASSLQHAFTERGAYELYAGSAEVACRVKFLEERDQTAIVPVGHGSSLEAGVRPGAELLVQVYCDRALPIVPGDRFVIRDVGRRETVAGGGVIDIATGTIRRGDEDVIKRLRERELLSGADLAEWLIRDRKAIKERELAKLSGAGQAEIGAAAGEASGLAQDGWIFAREHLGRLYDDVRERLSSYHEEHPVAAGMPSHELRRSLGMDEQAWPVLIDDMENNQLVVRDGSTIRLRDHQPKLGSQHAEYEGAFERLRDARYTPPDIRTAGLSIEVAKALERNGELVFITPEIAYPVDVWRSIEDAIVGLIQTNGPVTVSHVREAIGTTRKYAVPLLEKLDATGVTRRNGDVRELGPRGRELAGRKAQGD